MTKKYPSEYEIRRLADHYEQLGDGDILAEWERGAPVTIECSSLTSWSAQRASYGTPPDQT